MAKKTIGKKPKEKVSIFVSYLNQEILIEGGHEVDTYSDVLEISNEKGKTVAYFKEWNFVRIEYEEIAEE